MDWRKVFFSWDGRNGRKQFATAIILVDIGLIVTALIGQALLGDVAGPIVASLIFAYPRICVITKRLHDTGRSGWWQVGPNIVSNLLSRGASVSVLLSLAALIVAYGFLIWLGFQRSQNAKNPYGASPTEAKLLEVFD